MHVLPLCAVTTISIEEGEGGERGKLVHGLTDDSDRVLVAFATFAVAHCRCSVLSLHIIFCVVAVAPCLCSVLPLHTVCENVHLKHV